MEKLLDKLSSYDLFTNLIPGVIYCFLVERLFGVSIVPSDLLVSVFVYYFAGMIISRLGSTILEPAFQAVRVIRYAPYQDYLAAKEADPSIATLLEKNNSYRSMLAVVMCVFATGVWLVISEWCGFVERNSGFILLVLLAALFLSSYRKQTTYIRKRVERHAEKP